MDTNIIVGRLWTRTRKCEHVVIPAPTRLPLAELSGICFTDTPITMLPLRASGSLLRTQSPRIAASSLSRISLLNARRRFHYNKDPHFPKFTAPILWASLFGLSGAAVLLQNTVYLDAEAPSPDADVVGS